MGDLINKVNVTFVLGRLGYEILEDQGDLVIYQDVRIDSAGVPYFSVPFVNDEVEWQHLSDVFRMSGWYGRIALFLAELEA